MQALARDEINLHSHVEIHLDRCLNCRVCESACPSGVSYGRLLDTTRAKITKQQRGNYFLKTVIDQLSHIRRLNNWSRLFQVFQLSGLAALVSKLPFPHLRQLIAIARQLPPRPVNHSGFYPATQPTGLKVQLFTGCVGAQIDDHLIQNTLEILSRTGYAVDIPDQESCCGALHRHNGFIDIADSLSSNLRRQTGKSSARYLISIATACHLELEEHQASKLPLISIIDFLLELPPNAIPPLKPIQKRAALHTPCSARNDRSRELLAMVPDLELIDLAENHLCCGAAGSYLLTQPQISRRLGQIKLDHLIASQAELLITTNTGCAIQFRQLIKEAGLTIEVLHPVELILKQWNNTPNRGSNRS
jgi:glycolate oxidase iron-sulfur subunit